MITHSSKLHEITRSTKVTTKLMTYIICITWMLCLQPGLPMADIVSPVALHIYPPEVASIDASDQVGILHSHVRDGLHLVNSICNSRYHSILGAIESDVNGVNSQQRLLRLIHRAVLGVPGDPLVNLLGLQWNTGPGMACMHHP
jgi:hypothetical protein